MKEDIKTFIITYLECFLILIILGEVFPGIIEYLLNNYYSNPEFHKNSILVGGEVDRGLQIVYNYMRTFRLFLR